MKSGRTMLKVCSFVLVLWGCLVFQDAQAQAGRLVLREANRAYFNEDATQAIPLYKKVLAAEPAHPEANFKLGSLYLQRKQGDSAYVYLQKVYQLQPKYHKKLPEFVAQALHYAYRFDEAAEKYREMLSRVSRKDEEGRLYYEKKIQECMAGKALMAAPVKVEIVNAGPLLNTAAPEHVPIVLSRDTVLLFTSRRKKDTVTGRKAAKIADEDVYSSTFRQGSWTAPQQLHAPINTPKHDAAIAVSEDEDELYLYNEANGGDIYVSRRTGPDSWSEPEPMPEPINSYAYEPSIFITAGGQYAFFASDRDEGFGGLDIYLSMKQPDGTWGEAMNLGPAINTPFDEDAPFVDAENNVLYFSSRGHNSMGGYDIFRSSISESLWSAAENMGYPVNTPFDDLYLNLTSDRNHGFLSSDRPGGAGDKDLYYVTFRQLSPTDSLEPEPEPMLAEAPEPGEMPVVAEATALPEAVPAAYYLTGKITDAASGKPVAATITVTDNASQAVQSVTFSDSLNGAFSVPLVAGLQAGVSVEAPGYLFYSENLKMPAEQHLTRTISLNRVQVGAKVVLKNIFFESGKAELNQASQVELGRLFQLLSENKNLKIEISGHTDNKGAAAINMELSQKRSAAVRAYLVQKGIEPERLQAVGYGFSKPVASNATEEGRQLNRRTEFRIVAD